MARILKLAVLAAGLVALGAGLGCGGGEDPPGKGPEPPAASARLVYRNPEGTGWRLLRNDQSTPTHLVLDLVPPDAEGSGRGVALEMDLAGPGVAWAKVGPEDAKFVRNRGVYDPGEGLPVLVGQARDGFLEVAVAQKGAGHPASYGGGAVLSLALELVSAQADFPRGPRALTVRNAYHLPAGGPKVDIRGQLAVGTLEVQAGSGGGIGPTGGPGPDLHTQ